MSSDIVKRLREYAEAEASGRYGWICSRDPKNLIFWTAADRIEAAEAERDRLKAALVEVEDRLNCRGNPDIAHYCPNCDNSLHNAREIARKALGDAS